MSLGGNFVNGRKVYVTLSHSDSCFILNTNESNLNLSWTETLSLDGSQIFNIFGLEDDNFYAGCVLGIGRLTESELLCLSTISGPLDEEGSLRLFLNSCTEDSSNKLQDASMLQFVAVDVPDSDSSKNQNFNSSLSNGAIDNNNTNNTVANDSIIESKDNTNHEKDVYTVEFVEGPLGMVIKRRADGIVYVHGLMDNSQGSDKGILANDEITAAGNFILKREGSSKEEFSEFIRYIKDSPRPLRMIFHRPPEESPSTPSEITSTSTSQLSPITAPQTSPLPGRQHSYSDSLRPSNQGLTSVIAEKNMLNTSAPNVVATSSDSKLDIDPTLVELSNKIIIKDKKSASSLSRVHLHRSKSDRTPPVDKSNNSNISSSVNLAVHGRHLLKYGELSVSSGKQSFLWSSNKPTMRYLYLMSDVILVCSATNSDMLLLEMLIDLQACRLHTGIIGLARGPFAIEAAKSLGPQGLTFELQSPSGNISFIARSPQEREEWVLCIYEALCECVPESDRFFGWRHQKVLGTMHGAVLARDEVRVKEILAACDEGHLEYSVIDCMDEDCYTPLHFACILRLSNIVALIHENSDVTAKDKLGMTTIHWAAAQLEDTILQLLCTHVYNVDVLDDRGRTPLLVACAEGRDIHGKTDVDALRRCLTCLVYFGADINARDQGGITALHYIAASWHRNALKTLLNAGADVHAFSDENSSTALHFCCSTIPLKKSVGLGFRITNSLQTSSYLTSSSSQDALETVIAEDWIPTITSLLSAGAYPNGKDALGRSPLQLLTTPQAIRMESMCTAAAAVLLRGGARPEPGVLEAIVAAAGSPDLQKQASLSLADCMEEWNNSVLPDSSDESVDLTFIT